MDKEWLDIFFSHSELRPNRTGHSACPAGPPTFGGRYNYNDENDSITQNLGLGWLYYSLTRIYQPQDCICIGSGRGFAPILFAKGIKDNGTGMLRFIDPSLDDDFWKNCEKVHQWFNTLGIDDVIKHYLMTTEEFSKTEDYHKLKNIDLVYIDGSHFYEYVKFDFNIFINKISEKGIILFHDSISRSLNPVWHGPRKAIKEIIDLGDFQAFDLKFGAGLTLLQKVSKIQTLDYIEWCADQNKGSTNF